MAARLGFAMVGLLLTTVLLSGCGGLTSEEVKVLNTYNSTVLEAVGKQKKQFEMETFTGDSSESGAVAMDGSDMLAKDFAKVQSIARAKPDSPLLIVETQTTSTPRQLLADWAAALDRVFADEAKAVEMTLESLKP